MPSKLQLEKAAWQWAESVDPLNITREHVEAAYRVKCAACKANTCRRNCSGNPRCLSGLGERAWIQDVKDSAWHDIDDPNSERRAEGSFVGLKNLGATCYLNSFLQVPSSNEALRESSGRNLPCCISFPNPSYAYAIAATATGNPVPPSPPTLCKIGPEPFAVTIEQLANINFAIARKAHMKPMHLCRIHVNAAIDTWEKNLFCCLRRVLSSSAILLFAAGTEQAPVSLFTRFSQNSGVGAPVVSCGNITMPGRSSGWCLHWRPHLCSLDFFMMTLPLAHLVTCHCPSSGRATEVDTAGACSSVAHSAAGQLMETAAPTSGSAATTCVLVSSCLLFSTSTNNRQDLDIQLNVPPASVSYFVATLGPLSSSLGPLGHCFDPHCTEHLNYYLGDCNLVAMDARHLFLTINFAIDRPKMTKCSSTKPPAQKRKQAEGTHDSTGAYMLVYKRQGQDSTNLFPADKDVSFWVLPEHLKAAVSKDNEKFEQWVTELDAMRAETVSAGKERQTELRSLYEQMHIVSDESFDWVPVEWLVKLLAQEAKSVPPIDNSSVLCPHDLLDPQKVEKMKCISSRAANVIYEKFGGGPRLREALCERCVGMQCRFLRVKSKVQGDQKLISKLLKFKPSNDEPKVWVSKRSLQSWKHLALRPFGEQPSSSPTGDCNGAGEGTSGESDGSSSGQEDSSTLFFNEDIRCQHGGLLPNEAARRLVGLNVWEVLKVHFPTAAEFPESSQVCDLCQAHMERDLEAQGQLRQQASMEKQRLSELLQERNRPSPSSLAPGETVYIISREFLDQWKKFVRCPASKARPQRIVNAVLLCPHQKLLYVPGSDDDR
ncbi:unnamed protein product, partial [Ixodes hexagonus]